MAESDQVVDGLADALLVGGPDREDDREAAWVAKLIEVFSPFRTCSSPSRWRAG